MNYYKKNLQVIKQGSGALYKTVTASLPLYRADSQYIAEADNLLVKTTSGQCYLHSLYNKDRELKNLFSKLADDTKIIILFGLGMGHSLAFLASQFQEMEHLIVIEPNLDAFKHFLMQNDLPKVGGRFKRISFIVNQSDESTATMLEGLLGDELYRQPALIASISYRTLYADYFRGVQRGLTRVVRKMLINLSTQRYSLEKWLTNSWRNYWQESLRLEDIAPHITSLPVIIVSAGPSLNKNIHLLKEAKNKAMVIAVGSAISILDNHGIVPHLRMAFDGNKENKLVFNGVDTMKSPLLYCDALYHEILPNYHGPKIKMTLMNDFLTRYLDKLQQRETFLLNNGFSIANVAFDLACKLNSSHIILMGQDLCYTDDKMHADGSWSDGFIQGKEGMIRAEDIYQRPVMTSQEYLGMKNVFEDLIRAYRIKCINSSEGGLPILGSVNKPLRQVLDEELAKKIDITDIVEQAIVRAEKKRKDTVDNLTELMAKVECDLQEVNRIYQERLTLLREVRQLEVENEAVESILALLKEIQSGANQLQSIAYYQEVILPFMQYILQAIHGSFAYNGSDKTKQADALSRTYGGETAEVQRLLRLSEKLLEEAKMAHTDQEALFREYCLGLLV